MKIYSYDCVESTNLIAKELALTSQAPHGTAVVAQRQTAGKGRYGRKFCSPVGGIYMSVVLHRGELPFAIFGDSPTLVTAHAAAAVCKAIEAACDIQPQIKWVNDIFMPSDFVPGRKVCGISAEAVCDLTQLIIGIGLNFDTPQSAFPAELRDKVTSLFPENATPTISRSELIASICANLLDANAFTLHEYKRRMFMLKQKVLVLPANSEAYEATALDIDNTGQLVIQKDSGEIIALSSGEVSVRQTPP